MTAFRSAEPTGGSLTIRPDVRSRALPAGSMVPDARGLHPHNGRASEPGQDRSEVRNRVRISVSE